MNRSPRQNLSDNDEEYPPDFYTSNDEEYPPDFYTSNDEDKKCDLHDLIDEIKVQLNKYKRNKGRFNVRIIGNSHTKIFFITNPKLSFEEQKRNNLREYHMEHRFYPLKFLAIDGTQIESIKKLSTKNDLIILLNKISEIFNSKIMQCDIYETLMSGFSTFEILLGVEYNDREQTIFLDSGLNVLNVMYKRRIHGRKFEISLSDFSSVKYDVVNINDDNKQLSEKDEYDELVSKLKSYKRSDGNYRTHISGSFLGSFVSEFTSSLPLSFEERLRTGLSNHCSPEGHGADPKELTCIGLIFSTKDITDLSTKDVLILLFNRIVNIYTCYITSCDVAIYKRKNSVIFDIYVNFSLSDEMTQVFDDDIVEPDGYLNVNVLYTRDKKSLKKLKSIVQPDASEYVEIPYKYIFN